MEQEADAFINSVLSDRQQPVLIFALEWHSGRITGPIPAVSCLAGFTPVSSAMCSSLRRQRLARLASGCDNGEMLR